MIAKKAINQESFKRLFYQTDSAREAWKMIIQYLMMENPALKIILPAYIGWSTNEGSGIFDSVRDTCAKYDFYSLNAKLEINVDDLKKKVSENPKCLVLLVHYFGFVDKSYQMLTSWLKKEDILFVEDCAHAWLSDLLGGNCGRSGRFAFYSLHKLLPLSKGGILVDNKPVKDFIPFGLKYTNCFFDLNIDLFSIFEARRKNYRYLVGLLGDFDKIEILYKELPEGTCPQTMPIILKKVDRDKLYFEMNASGFGMVSLYHTMIKELNGFHSEAASVTSKNIINFPVHQDITKADYVEMIKILKSICYGI